MTTGVITGSPSTKTVQCETDLTNKEYYFATYDGASGDVVKLASGASEFLLILGEGADGSSEAANVSVVVAGETKLKLGGSVSAGDYITANSSGEGIATTTGGDQFGAIALSSGASGDLIPVLKVNGFV